MIELFVKPLHNVECWRYITNQSDELEISKAQYGEYQN